MKAIYDAYESPQLLKSLSIQLKNINFLMVSVSYKNLLFPFLNTFKVTIFIHYRFMSKISLHTKIHFSIGHLLAFFAYHTHSGC